jgi:hypothetical protein
MRDSLETNLISKFKGVQVIPAHVCKEDQRTEVVREWGAS